MKAKHQFIVAAVALGLIASGGLSPAPACTMCAEIPGTLGAVHPKSIDLALAIRAEIEAGRLLRENSPSVEAMPPSMLARRLAGLVQAGFVDLSPSDVEFVVIDSGARFRSLAAGDGGPELVTGDGLKFLQDPAVRWVTGVDVFHALLDERLTAADAVQQDILLVEPLSDSVTLVVRDGAPVTAGAGVGRIGPAVVVVALLVLVPAVLPLARGLKKQRSRASV